MRLFRLRTGSGSGGCEVVIQAEDWFIWVAGGKEVIWNGS